MLLFFVFVTHFSPAQAGDDPPFPWLVCEIYMEKTYGVWQALGEDKETPLFYLDIRSSKSGEAATEVITISQYNTSFYKVYQGVGFLSEDKKSLRAGMTDTEVKKAGYWIDIKTYCDPKTKKKLTMAILSNLDHQPFAQLEIRRVHDIQKEKSF